MRAIGKGGAAARIFCGLMNLPPPPAKFERHNSLFLNVLKTISEDSMNAAVHEAVIANDDNSNIAVAVDGTWHKKRLFFIERSSGSYSTLTYSVGSSTRQMKQCFMIMGLLHRMFEAEAKIDGQLEQTSAFLIARGA
ncbi:hypothetical protein TNCV_3011571 [Trichonephila clavipes]|nr:hypothetical protein TNCV_3011571 [Trichonephila clavipes]